MEHDQNHIIATLSQGDRSHFLKQCKLVELNVGDVISTHKVSQVYFPVSGLISVLSLGDATQNFEVGMIGREGMYGIPFALGLKSTVFPASVLYAGQAWRIPATALRQEMNQNKALQLVINRYINVVIEQLQHLPLHQVPYHLRAAGQVAADEPGSRACDRVRDHAGDPGVGVGCAAGRHHRCGDKDAQERHHRI
nr:hypothetical protein [Herbaspirillum sp. YR522]